MNSAARSADAALESELCTYTKHWLTRARLIAMWLNNFQLSLICSEYVHSSSIKIFIIQALALLIVQRPTWDTYKMRVKVRHFQRVHGCICINPLAEVLSSEYPLSKSNVNENRAASYLNESNRTIMHRHRYPPSVSPESRSSTKSFQILCIILSLSVVEQHNWTGFHDIA